MADFEFDPPEFNSSFSWDDEDEEEIVDDARQNLYHLTLEFLGYLYHQEQVPYAKGELARRHIYEYVLERHDGKLEPQEPLLKPKGRRKRKSAPRQPPHPLCPDRNTFDQFLAGLLHFINPQYYKATARHFDYAFVRLVNWDTDEELGYFSLNTDFKAETTAIVAELVHQGDGWHVVLVGQGYPGGLRRWQKVTGTFSPPSERNGGGLDIIRRNSYIECCQTIDGTPGTCG